MYNARNPEIQHLLDQLDHLASQWRNTEDPQTEAAIEARYGPIIEQLHALGWDGNMPIDSLLPLERMPEAYLRWYPDEANPTIW